MSDADASGPQAAPPRLEVEIDDVGFGPQLVALRHGSRRVQFLPGGMFALGVRNQATGYLKRVSVEEGLLTDAQVVTLRTRPPNAQVVDVPGLPAPAPFVSAPPVFASPFRFESTAFGSEGRAAVVDGDLAIRWVLLLVPEIGQITVVARMRIEGDTLAFDFEVDMASTTWSLFEVEFPILNVRPSADPEQDVVVMPWSHGGIVPNPAVGLDEPDPNKEYLRDFLHTGTQMSMQFTSHYVVDGAQLYLQTKDPDGYLKRFKWSAVTSPYPESTAFPARWARFALTHFPKNNARPGGVPTEPAFRNAYPIELSLMGGDWYDAARRYRGWALHQPWSEWGKFVDNPTFSSRQRLQDLAILRGEFNPGDFSFALSEIRAIRSYFGAKNADMLWNTWHLNSFFNRWPDYIIDPAVIPAMRRANAEGFRFLPYSLVMSWDGDTDFAARFNAFGFAAKRPDGTAQPTAVFGFGTVDAFSLYFGSYNISYAHEQARAIAVEQWARMARVLQADGQYLDDYSTLANEIDYDPSAAIAGGTADFGLGRRAFGRRLRHTQKQIDPTGVARKDFTYWAEFPNEFAVDVIEGVSSYLLFRPYLAFRAVPLQQVVYHEHQIAVELFLPNLELIGGTYEVSTMARAFHSGRGFAVFSTSSEIPYLPDPPSLSPNFPIWETIRRFIATNRALRRFRLWGERLRALPGSLEAGWDRGGPIEGDVQSSVWKFGDDVAAIFSNTGDHVRSFDAVMDRDHYPVVADAVLCEIDPEGAYLDPRPVDRDIRFTVVLPPHSVRAFVLTKPAPVVAPRVYVLVLPPATAPTEGVGAIATPWLTFDQTIEGLTITINMTRHSRDLVEILATLEHLGPGGVVERFSSPFSAYTSELGVVATTFATAVLPPGRYRLYIEILSEALVLQTAVLSAAINDVGA